MPSWSASYVKKVTFSVMTLSMLVHISGTCEKSDGCPHDPGNHTFVEVLH